MGPDLVVIENGPNVLGGFTRGIKRNEGKSDKSCVVGFLSKILYHI